MGDGISFQRVLAPENCRHRFFLAGQYCWELLEKQRELLDKMYSRPINFLRIYIQKLNMEVKVVLGSTIMKKDESIIDKI